MKSKRKKAKNNKLKTSYSSQIMIRKMRLK